MLYVAAALMAGLGLAHSILGERFIIGRLHRYELPKLLGSDAFTKQTLRFAWHLTTVAWLGLAAALVATAHTREIVGVGSAISAAFPLVLTRGRHLSWIAFAAIAVLCFAA